MRGTAIAVIALMSVCLLGDGARSVGAQADGMWLITEEQALLPDPPAVRGEPVLPKDGPVIRIVSPEVTTPVRPPVSVDVWFEPRPDGPPVKMSSLRVTYIKLLEIDVTDRFRPYINGTRVFVPEANVPQGRHRFRIDIADERGNLTAEILTVTVR